MAGRGRSSQDRSDEREPAEQDQDSSFMERVLRYVESTDTEWGTAASGSQVPGDAGERSELQVMVERKRRNDFVRRQEFELLRRIRREGLRVRELRATEASQETFQSTMPLPTPRLADGQAAVRDKIDDVEKTMAGALRTPNGESTRASGRPSSGSRLSSLRLDSSRAAATALGADLHARERRDRFGADAPVPKVSLDFVATPASRKQEASGGAAWQPTMAPESGDPDGPVDVDLEDAAYAFANADFDGCERIVQRLIAPGGRLELQLEVWLVLLDLHRATGHKVRFDAVALDCQAKFGRQPLAWVSIPRLASGVPVAAVNRAKAQAHPRAAAVWHCPPMLDVASVTALRQWSSTTPGTAVVDWSQVQMVDGPGAQRLYVLMTQWATSSRPMRWRGVLALVELLEFAAPLDDAQADRIFWMLRLALWRLLDRKDAHAEVGRGMASTYDVPEPTWDPPTRAVEELPASGAAEAADAVEAASDLELGGSDFEVSIPPRGPHDGEGARIELAGQITGDIGSTLAGCEAALSGASRVILDCSRLIRVDFIAAGELLNWISARRSSGQTVELREVHRLVALFLGVMGAKEHASMTTRTS